MRVLPFTNDSSIDPVLAQGEPLSLPDEASSQLETGAGTSGPPSRKAVRKHRMTLVVKKPNLVTSPNTVHTAERAIAELAGATGSIRRHLGPQQKLFADGEADEGYYFVLSGEFLIHRRRPGLRPAIRFAGPGDVVRYAANGKHEASCHAVTSASVACMECIALDALAVADPVVARHLERLAALEAALVQQAAPAREKFREPGCEQPDVDAARTDE